MNGRRLVWFTLLGACAQAPQPVGDPVALTVTPAGATADLQESQGQWSASAAFTATASYANGATEDVTARVQWSADSPATVAAGVATVGLVGSFGVSAWLGTLDASGTLTARLHGGGDADGFSPADESKLDGTPSSGTQVVYPLDGALFPSNLAPITVQVAKAAPAQSLARIELVADPLVSFRWYAPCEPGPNDFRGCYVTLPSALSSLFTQVSESGDVTLTARIAAPDGNQLAETSPIHIAWTESPLTGGLYYWTTLPPSQNDGTTGIARYDFAGDASKPQIVYTDKGSPPDPIDGNTCVGCHALTHDGTRMALTIGGSNPSDWMLLGVSGLQRLALEDGPDGFAARTVFSPDDTRMVTVHRGAFELRGTDASLADQGPVLASAVVEPKTDPFWSADGRWFAFTSWQPGMNGALPATDPNGLGGDLKTGSQIWIAHGDGNTIPDQATLLVPRAPGVSSFYPAIDDDGTLVVFDQSSCSGPGTFRGYGDGPCDGYSDPSARLFLTVPTGGAPIALDRANGPANSMCSWPRFSPDHGRFRGQDLYWIAFSSTRPYGVMVDRPDGPSPKPQLWFTAITLDPGAPLAADPSHPPVWLPGQNPDPSTPNGNHAPQWVAKVVSLQ
jgi:hypothetical protein